MSRPSEVTKLLHEKRWEQAMDALLAAWQSCRAPGLERAITALAEYLQPGLEPIDVEADDWQAHWDRRARDKRSVELGVLLPLVTHPPKSLIPRRMQALMEFQPDPRIGALLIEIVETPPTTSSSNFGLWTALFDGLPAHADQRVQARLEARAADRGGASQFWTKLENWIAAVIPKLQKPARVPRDWRDELRELEQTIAELREGPAPQLQAPSAPGSSTPSTDDLDLGSARASIEAGHLAEGLDHLVGFWAKFRNPKVATLIERLGLLVEAETKPLTAANKKALHNAWMAAAEHPRPSEIAALLTSLRDGKLADVEARIEMMVGWTPDPRVAAVMQAMIADYMLGARPRLWRAVYDALVVHADPRGANEIRQRHDRLLGGSDFDRPRVEGREIRRVFEHYVAAVEAPHELPSGQPAHLQAIEAALAASLDNKSEADPLERSLVEAIVAAWDDDGPRLVYSDWLQARDDPRGEFIAMSIALAQGKKVKGKLDKYYKAHKSAVLGPLESLVSWRPTFERGLLIGATVDGDRGNLDLAEDARHQLFHDLRWATIKQLRVDDRDPLVELFTRAPLLALERLEGPSLEMLGALTLRGDILPVRELDITVDTPDQDWVAFGELARVLPKLESLKIMIWGHSGERLPPAETFFRGALVRQLRVLQNGDDVSGGITRIDQWIRAMVATECPIPLLRVGGTDLSADIRQVEPGRFEIDLRINGLEWPNDDEAEAVLATLRGLPSEYVVSVESKVGDIERALRRQVNAALAPWR